MIEPVSVPIYLDLEMSPTAYELDVEDTVEASFDVDMKIIVNEVIGDKYLGPYSVTPTQAEQILETKNLVTTDNITIAAIPSNYGLIAWNGSVLTVS